MHWHRTRPRVGRAKNSSRSSFDGRGIFRFNNEERTFSGEWNEAGARKLWLYNLHYMAWIFDIQDGREGWIKRWIRENPFSHKGNGWEPYPVSLRLFNWCKHYSIAGIEPEGEVLDSIGRQAAWLLANLEYHLGGNHLLENLLSLTYASFFLETGDSRAMKARARIHSLLEAELSEQFLPDGGHFELSPMYHSILLERLLDLLDSWPDRGDSFPDLKRKLTATTLAGLEWLDAMSVGGCFALFNDSAYDAAPEAAILIDYGTRLLGYQPRTPVPLKSMEASGYFRAEAGPVTLIFDGGRLGPDHQMGHAQGDMLSICLWMGGLPIIVHPGNFEYVSGGMRDYCRSTASHNTLVIDGYDQADWWASHRVGWRGRPLDASASQDSSTGLIRIRGSHDGFSRLPGRPIHRRELEMTASSLVIRDSLSKSVGRLCRIYFHFHPECILEQEGDRIKIKSSVGILIMEADKPMKVEDSWYCPEFGLRIRNRAIVVESADSKCLSKLLFQT